MARFLYQTREFDCPVQLSMTVLMGKWKVLVLWQLFLKNCRYGELKRLVPGISHKVLSDTLKVLEEERFIFRHDFQENPPHVEYGLTDQGRDLEPILRALQQWGMQYKAPHSP